MILDNSWKVRTPVRLQYDRKGKGIPGIRGEDTGRITEIIDEASCNVEWTRSCKRPSITLKCLRTNLKFDLRCPQSIAIEFLGADSKWPGLMSEIIEK